MSKMPPEVIPVLCFAAGAIFGSWLYARGQVGKSPLPELPVLFERKPKPDKTPEPKVRP